MNSAVNRSPKEQQTHSFITIYYVKVTRIELNRCKERDFLSPGLKFPLFYFSDYNTAITAIPQFNAAKLCSSQGDRFELFCLPPVHICSCHRYGRVYSRDARPQCRHATATGNVTATAAATLHRTDL